MDIQTIEKDKAVIMTLNGKLDAVTAPEYEQKVSAVLAKGPCSLIIDFGQLSYISSAGLRALLATAKRIKTRGGQFHCAKVTGTAREVFNISGFSTIFQIWDSVEDALATLG